MYKHSDTPLAASRGDSITQLISEKIYYPLLEVVSFEIAERAAEGFGSTGKD